MLDPVSQAVFFGKVQDYAEANDPDKEKQLPALKDVVAEANHKWLTDPTEANGQQVVSALRTCGMHDEADAFATANLKRKPKFTIDGF